MMKSKIKKPLSSRHMRAIISGRGLRFNNDLGELTVTTWNVRTLHQDGKIENAVREMKRHGWDVLGISETRWKENGDIPTYGNTHFYFSGGDKHCRGVGFLVNRNIKECISGYIPQSERIILLQLNTKPIRTNLIQVYAPTSDSTQDDCEKFYEDLNLVMKMTKKHDLNIIMGDFNAKVGETSAHNIIGQYGLGERNDRGERLIEFCAEHTLIVMNTWFKLPKRRLYTWESPAHTSSNIIRNQIDYICVNRRFRNAITSVKTYPGADINSDHIPLVAKVKLRLKKLDKAEPKKVLDLSKLKNDEVAKSFRIRTDELISRRQEREHTEEDLWFHIKHSLLGTACDTLGFKERNCKKYWITEEIIDLFNKRRDSKHNIIMYKEVNVVLQNKIKEAKETELIQRCNHIEYLSATYQHGALHKAIKDSPTRPNISTSNAVADSTGKIIIELDERLRRWSEYILELYHDNRPNQTAVTFPLSGHPILPAELDCALQSLKYGKVAGEDGIPLELLRSMGELSKRSMLQLFNRIYDSGNIPHDLLRSIFVTIPKKPRATKCSDYRTISLMSHTTKVLLKIIYNRIIGKCEETVCQQQFGFRCGVGTREAIFTLNVLAERAIEMQQNVYLCFIDYEKAFDRVKHHILMDVLRKKGLDDKDLRLIGNLYWNQEAAVRIDGQLSDWQPITRGVRQGCILSPVLFNLYSEEILTDLLNSIQQGIIVNGVCVNNIRYADDTVLIASSATGLQQLLSEVAKAGEAKGLSINVGKTKAMLVSKNPVSSFHLKLKDQCIDVVTKMKYLGRYFTSDLDHLQEIKCRIGQAKVMFHKMSKILCSPKLQLELRCRLMKCYVWSTLLYGCETWVLKKEAINRLQAFEMWLYRRMLRITWNSFTPNIKVLERVNKERELMTTIMRRKLAFFGHLQRGVQFTFPRLILEGRIAGKRAPGRQRRKWMDDIRAWTGLSYPKIKEAALDRKAFHMRTAKLHYEEGTR